MAKRNQRKVRIATRVFGRPATPTALFDMNARRADVLPSAEVPVFRGQIESELFDLPSGG